MLQHFFVILFVILWWGVNLQKSMLNNILLEPKYSYGLAAWVKQSLSIENWNKKIRSWEFPCFCNVAIKSFLTKFVNTFVWERLGGFFGWKILKIVRRVYVILHLLFNHECVFRLVFELYWIILYCWA